MKKIINIMLVLLLLCNQTVSIYAEEEPEVINDEEIEEIMKEEIPVEEETEEFEDLQPDTQEVSLLSLEDDIQPQSTVVESGMCGSNATYTLYDDGTLVISGTGAMYDYINGATNPWYENKDDIREIVIQNGITSIGKYAFDYCENVISVSIPNSVTTIGDWSFDSCKNISSIIIPTGVISIGDGAFDYCENLASVSISDTVTTIGANVFNGCSSLTNIIIPNSVTSIGTETFRNCIKLESIQLSNKLTKIEDQLFRNCALMSITIPESVNSIGTGAFQECKYLTSIIIPENVTTISSGAFSQCSSLETVNLPSSINSLNYSLFYGCTSLASITIPESVTSIRSYAFQGCNNLTHVTIPESVTSIDIDVFNGCTSLIARVVEGSYAHTYCETNNINYELISNAIEGVCGDNLTYRLEDGTLEISGAGEMYTFEDRSYPDKSYCAPWIDQNVINVVINEGVTGIGTYAFTEMSSVKTVSLPSTITYIDEGAFNQTGLESVVIPGKTEFIEHGAFSSCPSLASVTLEEGVVELRAFAFHDCSSLTSVSLPSSLKTIENMAFADCENLSELTLSEGLETLGEYAIARTNIEVLQLPTSLKTLEGGALGESNLKYVYVPSTVEAIGDNQFSLCETVNIYTDAATDGTNWDSSWNNGMTVHYNTSLEAFQKAVKGINVVATGSCGDNAIYTFYDNGELVISGTGSAARRFSGVTIANVTSITVEEGITSLEGTQVLSGFSNVKTITLPSTLKTIPNYAFDGCTSLENITLNEGLTSIGVNAFGQCSSLTSIVIPSTVTSLGNRLFDRCDALESVVVASGNTTFDSRNNCNAIIETATNRLVAGCHTTVIPDSVEIIGDSSFYHLSTLTDITIPDSVTSIEFQAIYFNEGLTTLDIPDSVTSIDARAFESCRNITTVKLSNNLTSISGALFSDCRSLTSITIPEGVTTIGTNAFENCYSLASVELPEGLTSIGNYAFMSCNALRSITIPKSVTNIGYYGLGDNSLFKAYVYDNSYAKDYCVQNRISYQIIPEYLASGSCGENATYVLHLDRALEISGTGAIENYAFEANEDILKVKINEGIEVIEASAFEGCINMTSVELPDSLTTIESSAFANCSSLIELNIPKNVNSIGRYVLQHCGNIETITVDEENTTYDSRNNCNAIVKTAKNELIYGCQNSTIPEGIVTIGAYSFEYVTNLKELSIPSTVTLIDNYAFRNCTGLTKVVIPGNVKEIGAYAFGHCLNLEEVELLEGVEIILDDAFRFCEKLVKITIPKSVSFINPYAFRKTTNVEAYVYRNSYAQEFCEMLEMPYVLLDPIEIDEENLQAAETLISGPNENHYSVASLNALKDALDAYNALDENATQIQREDAYLAILDAMDSLVVGTTAVVLQSSPQGAGLLSGGGYYAEGDTISLEATVSNSGYTFAGWYDQNNTLVSSELTCEITASGEEQYLIARFKANEAKQLQVSTGLGKVRYEYNGVSGTWYNDAVKSIPKGTEITIEAIPYDGFEFLYWINSNRRIITDEMSYTFTLAQDLDFKPVYKVHTEGVYYVVFRNTRNFGSTVIQASDVEAGTSADEPDMSKYNYYGYQFRGWDQAFTKVTSDMVINAVYESVLTYTSNINGKIEEYNAGTLIRLNTAATDAAGKYFSGWYDEEDNLVSLNRYYSFYIHSNTVLNSKYEADEEVQDRPLIYVKADDRINNEDGTKQIMKATVNFHVPEGYEVIAVGIVRTSDAAKQDMLVLENVDGSTIRQNAGAKPTGNTGNYTLTLNLNYSTGAAEKPVYMVGYIQYKNGNEVIDLYSPVKISVPCERP